MSTALTTKGDGTALAMAIQMWAGAFLELTDWSDREIARRLGVSNSTVHEWRKLSV